MIRQTLLQPALEARGDGSADLLSRQIVDLASRIAGVAHASMVVLDAQGRAARAVTSGILHERRLVDVERQHPGAIGAVVAAQRPLRVNGLDDDPSLAILPRDHGPAAFLGAPIMRRGQVVGALYLLDPGGRDEFSDEDEVTLGLLAAQAGTALENVALHQAADARHRALDAINEMSQALLGGRSSEDVLRIVANWARGLVDATVAAIATPDAETGTMTVRMADGEGAEGILGRSFPEEGSICGEVMHTGRPIMLGPSSVLEHPDRAVVQVDGAGPAVVVPLAVGRQVFGTLSVANPAAGRVFDDDDLVVLQAFAAEAAVALQYGQIRSDLERLSLLEERERIAMELHDGVVQALFVVGLSLQAAQAVVHDPVEVEARLTRAIASIDGTIRDLRNYIFGLHPQDAVDHQLERALSELAGTFRRSAPLAIRVDVDPKAASLLAPRSADIIQMAREALSNATRHSGGTQVTLTFAMNGQGAILEIVDDGCGFVLEGLERRGRGLGNLQSRVSSLGGRLEIDSEVDGGTSVRFHLPV